MRAAPSEAKRSSAATPTNHDEISRVVEPLRDARAELLVDRSAPSTPTSPVRLAVGRMRDRRERHRVGPHREAAPSPPPKPPPRPPPNVPPRPPSVPFFVPSATVKTRMPASRARAAPCERRQHAARLRTVGEQHDRRRAPCRPCPCGTPASAVFATCTAIAEPVADRRSGLRHEQVDRPRAAPRGRWSGSRAGPARC